VSSTQNAIDQIEHELAVFGLFKSPEEKSTLNTRLDTLYAELTAEYEVILAQKWGDGSIPAPTTVRAFPSGEEAFRCVTCGALLHGRHGQCDLCRIPEYK
jgi:hypothetical protein